MDGWKREREKVVLAGSDEESLAGARGHGEPRGVSWLGRTWVSVGKRKVNTPASLSSSFLPSLILSFLLHPLPPPLFLL